MTVGRASLLCMVPTYSEFDLRDICRVRKNMASVYLSLAIHNSQVTPPGNDMVMTKYLNRCTHPTAAKAAFPS
jgi:hypothetical protein